MSDAREVLRLPRVGYMSEMIGLSKEIRYINDSNLSNVNIYALMGSPTAVTDYYFENNATISAAVQSGTALTTGVFPAGSTLTIINRGYIRAGGGRGGNNSGGASYIGVGGSALVMNMNIRIDNTGYIYAGGGGGGGDGNGGGGGGGGVPAGGGGTGGGNSRNGSAGTSTNGGQSGGRGPGGGIGAAGRDGGGGGIGGAGGRGAGGYGAPGARAGYSVQRNGNSLSWISQGTLVGSVV